MPVATSSEPTIGQIYEAFDAAGHRVFRGAMSRSRGGVVRVRDLADALRELAPADSHGQSALLSTAPAHNSREPACVPMSNEQALRLLLQAAFQLARHQPGGRTVITPAVLWCVLLLQLGVTRTLPASELLAAFGLVPDPRLVARYFRASPEGANGNPQAAFAAPARVASDPLVSDPGHRNAAHLRFPSPEVARQIEAALGDWIALQSHGREQGEVAAAATQLAQRMREIEQVD